MIAGLVLLLISKARTDINWPFTICDQGSYAISGVTLESQPARNSNNTFKVMGIANQDLNMKNVELEVNLNGHHLDNINISYNKEYDEGDKTFFKYSNYVPSFSPPGTYSLQFLFKTTSNKQVGCLQIQFKL